MRLAMEAYLFTGAANVIIKPIIRVMVNVSVDSYQASSELGSFLSSIWPALVILCSFGLGFWLGAIAGFVSLFILGLSPLLAVIFLDRSLERNPDYLQQKIAQHKYEPQWIYEPRNEYPEDVLNPRYEVAQKEIERLQSKLHRLQQKS